MIGVDHLAGCLELMAGVLLMTAVHRAHGESAISGQRGLLLLLLLLGHVSRRFINLAELPWGCLLLATSDSKLPAGSI